MINGLPQQTDLESLYQLSKEQLVSIILEQASVIKQLQATIEELKQEVEKLRVIRDLDSKTSSKPPSSDLLKKQEIQLPQGEPEPATPKRKPGGQLGHEGKTRKGFGRVDRYEILRPQVCTVCGHTEFASVPVRIETKACGTASRAPNRDSRVSSPQVPVSELRRYRKCGLVACYDTRTRFGIKTTSISRVDGKLRAFTLRKTAGNALGIGADRDWSRNFSNNQSTGRASYLPRSFRAFRVGTARATQCACR